MYEELESIRPFVLNYITINRAKPRTTTHSLASLHILPDIHFKYLMASYIVYQMLLYRTNITLGWEVTAVNLLITFYKDGSYFA